MDAYWRGLLRGSAQMPFWDDYRPTDLPDLADRLFLVERLHSFNRKFFPHWRRRYFCFERWTDLPLAGLAYLHAESLLTPPGPWVKTPDLAAR